MLWEKQTGTHPPDPWPEQIPTGVPELAPPGDEKLRCTFIGHATWLIQSGGVNVLTDPHMSRTASPFRSLGPVRFTPPGLSVEKLPDVHAVVLSHDHYDHLDTPTVEALRERFGDDLTWITPLGYRAWFAGLGITRLMELDWEGTETLETGGGELSVTALPAQHWTRRGRAINNRLWASYVLQFHRHRIYFGGDSGYFPGYRDTIRHHGPFDASLIPIGAYEPRWFMKFAHMNPEDALMAYQDLGGTGHFLAMHWGTFRLTFEDPLEPPVRMRRVWEEAGLDPGHLHTPGIGGTVVLD